MLRSFFMLSQILRGTVQGVWVVVGMPNQKVAVVTEQPSDFPARVAMVYDKSPGGSNPTDTTPVTLQFQHQIPLGGSQSIFRAQPPFALQLGISRLVLVSPLLDNGLFLFRIARPVLTRFPCPFFPVRGVPLPAMRLDALRISRIPTSLRGKLLRGAHCRTCLWQVGQ